MRKIAAEEHFYTEEYLKYLYSRKDCPKWEIVEDEKHQKIERRWNAPSLLPVATDPNRPSLSG
jgi:hypothetical protein